MHRTGSRHGSDFPTTKGTAQADDDVSRSPQARNRNVFRPQMGLIILAPIRSTLDGSMLRSEAAGLPPASAGAGCVGPAGRKVLELSPARTPSTVRPAGPKSCSGWTPSPTLWHPGSPRTPSKCSPLQAATSSSRAREPACGLTLISTGQLQRAKATLRATLDQLIPHVRRGRTVIGLEPSCTATLRSDLQQLLPDDPRAAELANSVKTIAEFLTDIDWRPPKRRGNCWCSHTATTTPSWDSLKTNNSWPQPVTTSKFPRDATVWPEISA